MVHLHFHGNLESDSASTLERTVNGCIDAGQLLVVHMDALRHASAEGLGALLDARQRLLANGLSLTLAGVTARMKILLSAWCLDPLFDEFKLEQERFTMGERAMRSTSFANLVGKEAGLTAKSEG
jgi:anti-anti-sigma factor